MSNTHGVTASKEFTATSQEDISKFGNSVASIMSPQTLAKHASQDTEALNSQMSRIISASPIELEKWLETQTSPEHYEQFRNRFIAHRVDGRCFCLLTEAHLRLIAPESKLGHRLHIINIKNKTVKAARVARRNNILKMGKCVCDPPNHSAEYALCEGSLNLTFRTRIKGGEPGAEREKQVFRTYVDYIDLYSIEDVDIAQDSQIRKEIIKEEVVKQVEIRSGCLGMSRRIVQERVVQERATGRETEQGVAKLFLLLNTPTMLGHDELGGERQGTLKLTLVLDNVEEGKALHTALVNQMVEHRGVQVTHQEGHH